MAGTYHEAFAELAWQPDGHLEATDVGAVLERGVRRMQKHLCRRGLLARGDEQTTSRNRAGGTRLTRAGSPETAGCLLNR